MDTPPNSTAVMKVFDDGALPTGRRLKGPPTAMARDHPEDLGLEKQALNEHGSSTSRPPYELTGRKEGLASSVAHIWCFQSSSKPITVTHIEHFVNL